MFPCSINVWLLFGFDVTWKMWVYITRMCACVFWLNGLCIKNLWKASHPLSSSCCAVWGYVRYSFLIKASFVVEANEAVRRNEENVPWSWCGAAEQRSYKQSSVREEQEQATDMWSQNANATPSDKKATRLLDHDDKRSKK